MKPDTDIGPSRPSTLGNFSGLIRSTRNIGMASALLDNNTLVLRLAPHQRLCCPKVNCQFARLSPAYASTDRSRELLPKVGTELTGNPKSEPAMSCAWAGVYSWLEEPY